MGKPVHGRTKTPEFHAWGAMLSRCYNPRNASFRRYGGRGITVCERWRESFAAFFADMGLRTSPKHSLDRIDSNGHYEPANCRWATWVVQERNRSTNRMLEFCGERQCITEWSQRTGLSVQVISDRLVRQRMTVEQALTTPLRRSHSHSRRHPVPADGAVS